MAVGPHDGLRHANRSGNLLPLHDFANVLNDLLASSDLAEFMDGWLRDNPHSQTWRVAIVDQMQVELLKRKLAAIGITNFVGGIRTWLIAEHRRNREGIHFTSDQRRKQVDANERDNRKAFDRASAKGRLVVVLAWFHLRENSSQRVVCVTDLKATKTYGNSFNLIRKPGFYRYALCSDVTASDVTADNGPHPS